MPEYSPIDPYRLLEDDLSTVYDEIREVSGYQYVRVLLESPLFLYFYIIMLYNIRTSFKCVVSFYRVLTDIHVNNLVLGCRLNCGSNLELEQHLQLRTLGFPII